MRSKTLRPDGGRPMLVSDLRPTWIDLSLVSAVVMVTSAESPPRYYLDESAPLMVVNLIEGGTDQVIVIINGRDGSKQVVRPWRGETTWSAMTSMELLAANQRVVRYTAISAPEMSEHSLFYWIDKVHNRGEISLVELMRAYPDGGYAIVDRGDCFGSSGPSIVSRGARVLCLNQNVMNQPPRELPLTAVVIEWNGNGEVWSHYCDEARYMFRAPRDAPNRCITMQPGRSVVQNFPRASWSVSTLGRHSREPDFRSRGNGHASAARGGPDNQAWMAGGITFIQRRGPGLASDIYEREIGQRVPNPGRRESLPRSPAVVAGGAKLRFGDILLDGETPVELLAGMPEITGNIRYVDYDGRQCLVVHATGGKVREALRALLNAHVRRDKICPQIVTVAFVDQTNTIRELGSRTIS